MNYNYDNVIAQFNKAEEENKKTINLINEYNDWLKKELAKIPSVLMELEDVLEKYKFDLQGVEGYRQTGGSTGVNNFIKQRGEGKTPQIILDLKLKMKGRKPYAGWEKNNYTTQYKQALVKCKRLTREIATYVRNNCTMFYIEINYYSLSKSEGILCTIWIR